mgnify:CR=1 FL=1
MQNQLPVESISRNMHIEVQIEWLFEPEVEQSGLLPSDLCYRRDRTIFSSEINDPPVVRKTWLLLSSCIPVVAKLTQIQCDWVVEVIWPMNFNVPRKYFLRELTDYLRVLDHLENPIFDLQVCLWLLTVRSALSWKHLFFFARALRAL